MRLSRVNDAGRASRDSRAVVPGVAGRALDATERESLRTLIRARADWSLLYISHLAELPAIRWRLQNLGTVVAAPARSILCTPCCAGRSSGVLIRRARGGMGLTSGQWRPLLS